MTRGDIVLVADRSGDFSGKPRPALIVQADAYNPTHRSITICPISSDPTDAAFFRIALEPTPANGLEKRCDVEVDKVQSVRRSRVGRRIGDIADAEMLNVDAALRRWLDL